MSAASDNAVFVPDVIPPCRVCGKTEQVAIYREDAPERTVCMDCCAAAQHHDGEDGHQFSHHHGTGWACDYCGVDRNPSNYDYTED